MIGRCFSASIKVGAGLRSGEGIGCWRRKKNAPQNCTLWVTVLFLCLFSFKILGQEPAQEYQIKAAFLFNFAKFVEWPPDAFPNADSPIIIGVLGKNVFGHYLEDTIRGKTVQNRPFLLKEFKSVDEAVHCHILFIDPSVSESLSGIIKDLHNTSVLTVSETDQFLKAGGMVNFIIEDNKVHFQINDEAAKAAGLKVSSKLLSLAAHNH